LQGLNELNEIIISETLMGPAGLIALADNFPLMPKLKILDLRKNSFGIAASSKFRLLFSKTPGLIDLNLS